MTVDEGRAAPAALPPVVDRTTWDAERATLLVREKAHSREGDAIAAARRRLPMVEVDPGITLRGADGPTTLLEVFEGRGQLIAYQHMWHDGQPAARQCPGCTFYAGQVRELAVLHSHDVTFAVFCVGPYAESARYRDFMGWDMPWYSIRGCAEQLHAEPEFMLACYVRDGDRVFETWRTSGRGVEVMGPTYGLLDRTVRGRQERWEDSPEGWPQRWTTDGDELCVDGRPAFHQARLAAGRDDDLGTGAPGTRRGCCGVS